VTVKVLLLLFLSIFGSGTDPILAMKVDFKNQQQFCSKISNCLAVKKN